MKTDGITFETDFIYLFFLVKFVDWRTSQYWVSDENKNWIESEKVCTDLGGHLASIRSEDENSFVKSMLDGRYEYWIGLSDRDEEGNFTWTDGSAVAYKDWRKGEPNGQRRENCGHYFKTVKEQKWNDEPCNRRKRYICKISGNVFNQ